MNPYTAALAATAGPGLDFFSHALARGCAAMVVVLVTTLLAACGGSDPAAPVFDTPPSAQNVADGATASFSVGATGQLPLGYQWQRNGSPIPGATAADYTFAARYSDNGARFSVVVSDANGGSVTSAVALLTVTPLAPSLLQQPQAANVQEGQGTAFSVQVAGGTAPLAYQWQRNGIDIAGATGSTVAIAAATLADDGARYRVRISNPAGTLDSAGALLTVSALPVAPAISAQPQGRTVNAGQTASFQVTASGSGTLTYQWLRNGTPIAGATADSHTTPPTAGANDGDRYSVDVGNAVGTTTSAEALLTVVVAPAITTAPANRSVFVGQTAAFSVVAGGGAPLVYQWRRNGVDIAGANAASHTTPATVLADSGGTYSVRVSNAAGSVTSGDAVLTVQAVTVSPTITTQPASIDVTEGQTATFSVVAAGTAPLAYQWRRNGAGIVGASAASYTTPASVLADSGALYSVVVSNATPPAVTSANATLQVFPALSPVAQVLAHANSSMVGLEDGTLWHWGQGAGNNTPARVQTMDNVDFSGATQVSGQSTHWLARRSDGSVWAWGTNNNYGELGNGSTSPQPRPAPVLAAPGVPLTGIGAVVAGQQFSLALRTDGTVLAWGLNQLGMLGDGTGGQALTSSPLPVQVIDTTDAPLSNVVALAAAERHALALKSDGTVWAWGSNSNGQLGDGSFTLSNRAKLVETAAGMPLSNVVAVGVGLRWSIAVRNDGSVWIWGGGGAHLCRTGFTAASRPVQVLDALGAPFLGVAAAAGSVDHTSLLKTDGSVWSCGANTQGQLGDGSFTLRTSPVPVLDAAGATFNGVDQLSTTASHVLVRRSDKTVWAWGNNGNNKLGNAAAGSNSAVPVKSKVTAP